MYAIIRHVPINPKTDRFITRAQQKRDRRSGVALIGHQDSAHGGAFDPNCPACAELKKYMVNQ